MSAVEILLSNDQVAVITEVDHGHVSRYRWHALARPHTTYASANIRKPDGRWTQILMHRLLLGAPNGMHVDHINHDGLDNRRENLRLATNAQNMANLRLSIVNTSGYKGVCWDKRCGRWMAKIRVNGRHHFLGRYDDPWEAAQAYNAAALEAWGDFALLNERTEFMAALDGITTSLKWSQGFRERAGVESRGLSETEKDERDAELNRGVPGGGRR